MARAFWGGIFLEGDDMAGCKWCGKEGLFVRIDSNGLCKKCEHHAPLRIIPSAKQMKHFIAAADVVKTTTSKVTNYDTAIYYAGLLLPYEKKGIPTCEPSPSNIIEQCNAFKDEVIVEELEQIFTKASDRARAAKSHKGVDAARRAGLKKVQEVSSRLFDQTLMFEYKEKLEILIDPEK